MVRMRVAKRKAAGAPMPLPKPTTSGVLKSMAEIGAEPVTVRKRTPGRPMAFRRRVATSPRFETSKISASATAIEGGTAGPTTGMDSSVMLLHPTPNETLKLQPLCLSGSNEHSERDSDAADQPPLLGP